MTARCVSFALTGLVALGMVAAQPAKAALISFVEDPLESRRSSNDGSVRRHHCEHARQRRASVSATCRGRAVSPQHRADPAGHRIANRRWQRRLRHPPTLKLCQQRRRGRARGDLSLRYGRAGLAQSRLSGAPDYCSTTPGDGAVCAAGVPNSEFKKTGGLLAFFPSAALPGTSDAIPLEIDVTSPLQGVPEPAALVLFMSGLALFGAAARFGRHGN